MVSAQPKHRRKGTPRWSKKMKKKAVLRGVVDKLWERQERLTEERKENQVEWTEGNGEPVPGTKWQRENNLEEIKMYAERADYSLECDQQAEKQDANKKNQTTNPAKHRRKGEKPSRVTTPNVAALYGPGVPPPDKRQKQGPPTYQSSADPIDLEIRPPTTSEVPSTPKLAVSTLPPPSSEVPTTPKLAVFTLPPPSSEVPTTPKLAVSTLPPPSSEVPPTPKLAVSTLPPPSSEVPPTPKLAVSTLPPPSSEVPPTPKPSHVTTPTVAAMYGPGVPPRDKRQKQGPPTHQSSADPIDLEIRPPPSSEVPPTPKLAKAISSSSESHAPTTATTDWVHPEENLSDVISRREVSSTPPPLDKKAQPKHRRKDFPRVSEKMRKEAVLRKVVDKLRENVERLTEERKKTRVGWTKRQRKNNLKQIKKYAENADYSLECDQQAEKQDAKKKNRTTNPAKRRRKGEKPSRVRTPNVAALDGPGVPPPDKRQKQGPPTHQSSADPIDLEIRPPTTSEVPPTPKLAVSTLAPPSSEVPPTPKLAKAISSSHELAKTKETIPRKKPAKARKGPQRNRRPHWMNSALHVVPIFEECEEKSNFVERGVFMPPDAPTSEEEQKKLVEQLLSLYDNSNLPPVPEGMRSDLLFLRYYPRMKTLIRVLKAEPGREIKLKDNCWFLCFENFQMVSKSEQEQLIEPNILRTAENKFACKFCADSDVDGGTTSRTYFNKDKDIKRHIATHLKDQFYVCCFCDSQNNCVTDLRRHATGHTDYRLFHCKSCNQSFIQQVSYDTHMKNHHG
ncbi:serine/arginine repetitive matrix protein 1 isoform X3 [Aplysia californica]|uniref:Serine/arginine repetitive matrix protein 1 isoform X2 n=1 Tax=Aplysia californica TaxID=6500 RepID=A0ABM1W0P1_APLCA|nr:serine/arginine repetitive matrix protein 1 isoform X2 [Aplysia californica]XP_035828235.1 serine/arginine repetitive matrix protein 1 isoform X3 [Aplysia californica]